MPRRNWESGLKNIRAEYVAETDAGTTPDDPAWSRFSDSVQGIAYSPEVSPFPVRGLGEVDPAAFERGAEAHPLSIRYYLQQGLGAGAIAAGIPRDADNLLSSSHSVLVRDSRTVDGGRAGGGQSLFTHLVGAWIASVEIAGNVGTGEPMLATLGYQAEKGRSYRVDQPTGAAATLTVESADAADSGANYKVTLEDKTAAVSEEVELEGEAAVATTAKYASLEGLYVTGTARPRGDIIVKTSGEGAVEIARLRGSTSTKQTENDEGVPLLGAGSRGAAIGGGYFADARTKITYAGESIGSLLRAWNIRVANDLRREPQSGSRREAVFPQLRTLEFTSETAGEAETHRKVEAMLRGLSGDLVLSLNGGGAGNVVTMRNAEILGGPTREYSLGEGLIVVSSTFTARGMVIA